MKKKLLTSLLFAAACVSTLTVGAQTIAFADQRAGWLEKARANMPELIRTEVKPQWIVCSEKDPEAFQEWKMVRTEPIDSLYHSSFKSRKEVIVDFGDHYTDILPFGLITPACRPTPRCVSG